MNAPRAPSFEPWRRQQLRDELLDRARLWLPDWRPCDGRVDFATAIVEIAARLEAEVTQRLDKVPTKTFRGFLSWLGIRGQPGRAARLPVVFSMTAGSPPVLAEPPVQLQASGGEAPVTFETEQAVQILPGQLATLVAADPEHDTLYLPPPGLFRLEAPPVVPNEWRLKSPAERDDTRLQLEPALGLTKDMVLSEPTSAQQYRVAAVEAGIVTIDPPLGAGLNIDARIVRVDTFDAFGDTQRDRQEHALYIGSDSALSIETPAFIEVTGGALIPADAQWSYWGKPGPAAQPTWLPLTRTVEQDRLFLFKPAGAIEQKDVDGHSSRWIRSTRSAGGFAESSKTSGLRLKVNCQLPPKLQPQIQAAKSTIQLEGIANTAPLVLNAPFYPLGREPRLFDAFYLGCKEAFSKPEARVTLEFTIDASFSSAPAAIAFGSKEHLVVGVGRDGKLHRLAQREILSSAGKPVPDITFLSPTQPQGADGRPISLNTGVRPGAVLDGHVGYVTVAAGKEVWLWSQPSVDGAGNWASLGVPGASATSSAAATRAALDVPVETVLVTGGAGTMVVYALSGKRLYQREALGNAEWLPVAVLDDNGEPVPIARIAPIVKAGAQAGELSDADGMVCVSDTGELFLHVDNNPWQKIDVPALATDTYPLVVTKKGKSSNRLFCFARLRATQGTPQLITFDVDNTQQRRVVDADLIGHAFTLAAKKNSVVAVLVGMDADGNTRPALWTALGTSLHFGDGPVGASLAEAPVRLGSYYLFPGDKGNVSVATLAKNGFAAWKQFEPARPRNPELSWEYWNGTGWWQIATIHDETGYLVNTGLITFCVPTNLQPTDVIGRTNHWIRARLVGGDYGQETVQIVDKPGPGGPIHEVVRNSDSVHPPYVISLEVSYEVCCPAKPDFVLTKDSGATRDQTSTNRTDGAIVEYFVPLAETLARLASPEQPSPVKSGGSNSQSATSICVDCTTGAAWPSPRTAAPDAPAATQTGRALYLGFNTELKGGPISILFLVNEGNHDDAYPLRVDALIGNRFKRIVAQDGTRGLNESGIVALTLAESPQLTELFGKTQYWLRLRPRFDSTAWRPQIRGAYLNATWASAAETQSLEVLGSSDGAPNQRVTLARPPVLADSQKLRIRELLGDEDIAALRREDLGIVLDTLGPWPGPWVLWREVGDPADCGVGDRVYALDDATGEIRFGDGLHGMIPPIGRDVIVAERYQRGGGTAANKVVAWSQLNLITPLQGVESVGAPDGAAGGSDAQDAATTIRFAPDNLNMRDRALTLRDFELLALQFSPDIGQVRALATRMGVRLIVVMRGRDPQPSKATVRELHRYLVGCSPPMLSAPDALQIIAPEPILTRVRLGLTITAVEHSGSVAKEVLARMQRLLDPAIGDHDGTGWRLAEVPSETDIAAALIGIKYLESIDSISLRMIKPDGTLSDISEPLRPPQLLHLAPDGVSVEFAVSEVIA